MELPINALIRPIPRALWPSKPEGLSFGIEDALSASGLTLSATFVGEAYMAGGFAWVLFTSLLFGASATWWNRFGRDLNGKFNIMLYASGFLWAGIGMRSMLVIVPVMLPTVSLWLYGRLWLNRRLPYMRPSSPTS